MKHGRAYKLKSFFLYLGLLSSLIYSLGYLNDVLVRAWLLRASYDEKQTYIEKTFKYLPVYGIANTILNELSSGSSITLFDDHTNYMYYYSRLNYFLYPAYISADVKTIARINDGDSSALKKIKLGNNVIAIDLRSTVFIKGNEKPFVYIANTKFAVIARTENNSFLLKRGQK